MTSGQWRAQTDETQETQIRRVDEYDFSTADWSTRLCEMCLLISSHRMSMHGHSDPSTTSNA
jgi:hypothetical protein